MNEQDSSITGIVKGKTMFTGFMFFDEQGRKTIHEFPEPIEIKFKEREDLEPHTENGFGDSVMPIR